MRDYLQEADLISVSFHCLRSDRTAKGHGENSQISAGLAARESSLLGAARGCWHWAALGTLFP